MSKDVQRLLSLSDKGTSESENALAEIFRKFLWEKDVSLETFNRDLDRWLDDPKNRIINHSGVRSNDRGNFVKAIAKNRLSWEMFVKAMTLLNPVKFTISVTCDWGRGKSSTAKKVFRLQDVEDYELMLRDNSDSKPDENKPLLPDGLPISQ